MNAGKASPEVEVEIKGESYKLVFGLRAMCELEKRVKQNPLAQKFWENLGPNDLAAVLWAGMLKHNKVSFDKVVDMIDTIGELGEIFMKAQQAFGVAQMEPDQKKMTE